MNIDVSTSNMKFLESLSSDTRIKIIQLLSINPMNIKEIATELFVSSSIVTKHIQKLEHAGIVKYQNVAGKRGTQKVCSLCIEQVILNFKPKAKISNIYLFSIPVGHYLSYFITPTCGIASTKKLIGMLDDPRYFSDTERVNAALIWFSTGWVEYRIPNYLHSNQKAKSIQISFEICSEAPGFNEDWPSDITFYINDIKIGYWTSPGDFGKNKGVYTPDWWPTHDTQHGHLKTLNINEECSFIDGVKISDTNITDINLAFGNNITFKIENSPDARNVGGVNLFGKGFGNYNQNIEVSILY